MESSASSPGVVIPRDKLKIFEIFRDVGPEGEEILKTAKLAHVVDTKHGVVVTTTDETYTFVRERGCKITRIPNLCGVRVKEFVVNIDGLGFVITEEGSLYCLPLWDMPPTVIPHLVAGSLAGKKVQQVVLRRKHVLTLTQSGNVYHNISEPRLIGEDNFDSQEVISIACTADGLYVGLTSNRELFEWGLYELPEKVIVDTAPLRKIVGINHMIFALTVEGTLYSGRFRYPKPVWTVVMKDLKFHDVTTSGSDDVLVAELKKDNIRLAVSYRGGILEPQVLSISPNVTTSLDELFAEIGQSTWRTISAKSPLKPVTLGDDIGALWVSKENLDVVFSVEGKTISAHKCILACRSEYFAKMFNHEWKEAQGVIDIKDTQYEIFESLLFYIYNDKVSFGEDEYENIFGLMMLADSYCDLKIRQGCEEILIRNINEENAFFLVRHAGLANASDLERNVVKFILNKRLLEFSSSSFDELIELFGVGVTSKILKAELDRG
ncbi:RCC1 and BTB domain-containing protein 1 isoform X2 [Folsomia candida]|uniref:RCC1 and BTB domain-containing protein 1 isoform X2 n=1 Tax=Folsomia candida TaxID=158441 RepID=UPI000B8F5484|nr:RCC1 and BTB domain-containing protein 1 isoform X2 [Folsomia candida]